jgi:cell wall-associated NlpC family hydrolase
MTFSAPIALDPGVGGYSVGFNGLQDADIIISTTKAGISLGIRVATGSVVSHAALYCGSGSVIEAIKQGVVSRPLEDSLADDRLAVAYRHPEMTPKTASLVIAFASGQLGKGYDLKGAMAAGNLILCSLGGARPSAFFCSELVVEAYKQAGLPLGILPSQCYTPDDVAKIGAQRLVYAGHLKGNTSWFPVISP